MTVRKSIQRRVKNLPPGAVFTPTNFADLGTPQAVGMALARLVRGAKIRRVGRGLYDVPREHPTYGTLGPDIEIIARALADRDGIKLQPTGAYAANLLGLSEQVPMKIAYLTDGTARTVRIGEHAQLGSRNLPLQTHASIRA